MNPIQLEEAIVARLTAKVKDAGIVRFVYDTKGYGEVREQSQLSPALAVIYNGYRADQQVGDGVVQAVIVEFLVVAVTSSSNQTLNSTGARVQASEIFDATVKALAGWKPATGNRRLHLADAPGVGYSDAGFAYTPMAFTSRITYHHQP